MTAATATFAQLTFAAQSGSGVTVQRRSAPCLGLAQVAGAALWVGIGSTLAMLLA